MRLEDRPDSPHSGWHDEAAIAGRLSREMQTKLETNRGKLHWRHTDVTNSYLIERLKEEVRELVEAVETGRGVWSEAADVANFAAMLADRSDGNTIVAGPVPASNPNTVETLNLITPEQAEKYRAVLRNEIETEGFAEDIEAQQAAVRLMECRAAGELVTAGEAFEYINYETAAEVQHDTVAHACRDTTPAPIAVPWNELSDDMRETMTRAYAAGIDAATRIGNTTSERNLHE